MTTDSICPLVVAKVLHITRTSWEITEQNLVQSTDMPPPSDRQKRARHNGEMALRLAPQGFALRRNTGGSAHPPTLPMFSDGASRPST